MNGGDDLCDVTKIDAAGKKGCGQRRETAIFLFGLKLPMQVAWPHTPVNTIGIATG